MSENYIKKLENAFNAIGPVNNWEKQEALLEQIDAKTPKGKKAKDLFDDCIDDVDSLKQAKDTCLDQVTKAFATSAAAATSTPAIPSPTATPHFNLDHYKKIAESDGPIEALQKAYEDLSEKADEHGGIKGHELAQFQKVIDKLQIQVDSEDYDDFLRRRFSLESQALRGRFPESSASTWRHLMAIYSIVGAVSHMGAPLTESFIGYEGIGEDGWFNEFLTAATTAIPPLGLPNTLADFGALLGKPGPNLSPEEARKNKMLRNLSAMAWIAADLIPEKSQSTSSPRAADQIGISGLLDSWLFGDGRDIIEGTTSDPVQNKIKVTDSTLAHFLSMARRIALAGYLGQYAEAMIDAGYFEEDDLNMSDFSQGVNGLSSPTLAIIALALNSNNHEEYYQGRTKILADIDENYGSSSDSDTANYYINKYDTSDYPDFQKLSREEKERLVLKLIRENKTAGDTASLEVLQRTFDYLVEREHISSAVAGALLRDLQLLGDNPETINYVLAAAFAFAQPLLNIAPKVLSGGIDFERDKEQLARDYKHEVLAGFGAIIAAGDPEVAQVMANLSHMYADTHMLEAYARAQGQSFDDSGMKKAHFMLNALLIHGLTSVRWWETGVRSGDLLADGIASIKKGDDFKDYYKKLAPSVLALAIMTHQSIKAYGIYNPEPTNSKLPAGLVAEINGDYSPELGVESALGIFGLPVFFAGGLALGYFRNSDTETDAAGDLVWFRNGNILEKQEADGGFQLAFNGSGLTLSGHFGGSDSPRDSRYDITDRVTQAHQAHLSAQKQLLQFDNQLRQAYQDEKSTTGDRRREIMQRNDALFIQRTIAQQKVFQTERQLALLRAETYQKKREQIAHTQSVIDQERQAGNDTRELENYLLQLTTGMNQEFQGEKTAGLEIELAKANKELAELKSKRDRLTRPTDRGFDHSGIQNQDLQAAFISKHEKLDILINSGYLAPETDNKDLIKELHAEIKKAEKEIQSYKEQMAAIRQAPVQDLETSLLNAEKDAVKKARDFDTHIKAYDEQIARLLNNPRGHLFASNSTRQEKPI